MHGVLTVPDIQGESSVEMLAGGIDVFGLDWKVSQVGDVNEQRRSARRQNMQAEPMMLSKRYDAASPYLAHAAHKGQLFHEVVLSICRERGNEQVPYLTFALTGCAIGTYGVTSDGDADVLTETFSLTFEKMLINYVQMSDEMSHEVALIL
jgi:type VI secretion system Hcp family effector